MNNILEERDKDVVRRQRLKKRLDNIINLSADATDARLLDEGVVVDGSDNIRFIIKKGAIKKYMNGENSYLPNIDDNYKGFINLGHQDFYANPVSLIGEWTKSDLTLVDIGNERYGLDVNVHLWDWHPTVELLHKLPYTVGVSAELVGHINWEDTDELGYLVYDEICITDFAVVGNGANANSNGLMLKGEPMDKDLKKLQETLARMEEKLEAQENEPVDEPTDEPVDEPTDEPTDEPVDEPVDEPAEEEPTEDEPTVGESEALAEIIAKVEALTEKMENLEKENEALKSSLSEKEQGIKEFTDKFQKLSVKLNPALVEKPKVEVEASRYGDSNDGIGV